MVAVLMPPPDDHRNPSSTPHNSFGFFQRGNRVGCVLERVEASHDVKACLRVGQLFHVSNAEVPFWYPFTRNLNECWRGVNPADLGTELCG
jgi:hypothetical protein